MKNGIFALVFFISLGVAGQTKIDKPLTRVAFGSCSNQDKPQPLWDDIIAQQPDLWIWLGDNIYGDSEVPDTLKAKWNRQLANPGYSRLMKSTPIVGIWDDHDFGQNNVGADNPIKKQAQQLFLDFLGEDKDSPRRSQEGIYTTYVYGPAGQQVKLFLLDTRYGKVNNTAQLDSTQWAWLEREIKSSTAQLNVFCTGTQFLVYRYSWTKESEAWGKYKGQKERLEKLIETAKLPGVVFLSGDVHHAEIMRDQRRDAATGKKNGTYIYEVTASGMTHTFRLPFLGRGKNVTKPFFKLNYGAMNIDWAAKTLTLQVLTLKNEVAGTTTIPFIDLGIN